MSKNLIWLNVGGEKFCTSQETLTWHPDTFFTGLLRENGVGIAYDRENSIFIDRDPHYFKTILHFLRTRRISIPKDIDPTFLHDEAEFYGVSQMTERLRLCCELKEESCGGIHFYEMLKLKQLPKVTIITGNGPLLAIASNLNINLFVFDEHHGWNSVSVLDVEHEIDHLSVKYLSPKRIGDSLSGPLCHLAIASGSLIRFFKVIENELRGDFKRYKFHELDGHDFSKKNTTDRNNSTSSNSSVPSSVPNSDETQVKIEYLKFVGSQLLAVSENSNKMAVWNAARQGRWQQHSTPEKVLCLESVSTFVYMGSETGRIHYTDLQKFPLRTKDNSLLVTELHNDYLKEPITALSVSYERNPVVNEKCDPFESLELCYGTANGTVRVLVQSPEHHGHHGLRSLQLLQTYKVHSSPITSVELSEKFLISCCSRRHVRTWSMTRFRGVLSTQPGSVPFSDFELTSQAQIEKHQYGPFGDQSEIPIFIQQPIQYSDTLYIRTGDTGSRIATFRSVTGPPISTYASHDFEGSPRMGLKPRRLILTGHTDGTVQIWDIAKALDEYRKYPDRYDARNGSGNITATEIVELSQRIDQQIDQ